MISVSKNCCEKTDCRFVFWARHFNDIDHVVPIIYSLIKNKVSPKLIRYIALYPCSTLVPDKDARLIFLSKLGVVFEMPHLKNKWFSLVHQISYKESSWQFFSLIYKTVRLIFYRYIIGSNYKKWPNYFYAKKVIKQVPKNSVFIFDHNSAPLQHEIVELARAKGIVSIAVPHGLVLHEGFIDKRDNQLLYGDSCLKDPLNMYAKIIMPNELLLAKFKAFEEGKVHMLGSIRFTNEWLEQLSKIYPSTITFSKHKKTKVLFLVEKEYVELKGRKLLLLDLEKQIEAIRFLLKYSKIDLVVKLNTRGVTKRQLRSIRALNCRLISTRWSTFELISWADVIIGSTSSVLLDAVILKKPIIIMSYLSKFKLVFNQYPFPFIAKSFREFVENIEKTLEDPVKTRYKDINLEGFVEDLTKSSATNSVIDRYAKYLLDLN